MKQLSQVNVPAAVLAAVMGAGPVQAQQSAAQPTIAEVIVTAQKREQSLQDVPISVVELGDEQLEQLGIRTLRDIAGNVPNLVVNNFNGRADIVRLFIRGIGQNDVSITQDPSVALYVDGIYVGTAAGAAFEWPDVERIEVLRGPQGTLYGRNATGGAVNIILKKPSADGVAGRIDLTGGNFNLKRASGVLNLPLGRQLALRVSGLFGERDGWIKNTGPGEDFGGQDRDAVRAALRWSPSDSVTADYTFELSKVRDTPPLSYAAAGMGSGTYPLGAPFNQPGLGLVIPAATVVYTNDPLTPDRPGSVQAARLVEASDTEVQGHALALEWRVSDALTLRSLSGYRDVHADQLADYLPTGTATIVLASFPSLTPLFPLGAPSAINESRQIIDFRTFSQEFQAFGETKLKRGGSLGYVGGLYYYTDDARLADVDGSVFGPRDPNNLTTIEDESYALFTDLTWTPPGLGERLHLTAGARYSEDRRRAFRIQENSFSFAAVGGFTAANCARFAATFAALGQTCVPNGAIVGSRYERNFSNSSFSGTVTFDFASNVSAYAKYVSGYKTGGTSQRSANPVKFAEGFEPEDVVSYEIGLKSSFLDRRMTLNTAIFQMDIDNFQASVQTGASPGDRDFYGVDGSQIRGIEAEFAVALTSEWRLRAQAGLLDTKWGAPVIDVMLDTGVMKRETFVESFSYAPRRSFTLGIDYGRALGTDWRLDGFLSYNYQSEMINSNAAGDVGPLPARGLADAGVSLTRAIAGSGELMLRLWGRNLSDKQYLLANLGSFGFAGATSIVEFGEPRTYGVTLDYRF